MLTLVIPDAPPSLNRLLRMHWRARERLQDRWTHEIWAALRGNEGLGKGPVEPLLRAQVTIERRSPRELDTDNCYASMKPVVDSLKVLKLITDDNPEHLTLTVTQSRGPVQT